MKIEWIILFIGVGIAIASLVVWLIARRQTPPSPDPVNLGLIRTESAPAPPGSVSPGMVNALLDGAVVPRDLFLTMIDLAVRGYFILTSPSDDSELDDWALKRTDKPARGLRDFEATLLEAPNVTGKDEHGAILAILVDDAEGACKKALAELRGAVARAGWFTSSDSSRRRPPWGVIGGVVMLIGLAGAAVALVAGFRSHPWLGLAGAALMIASALLLVSLTRMRPAITAIGDQTRGEVQRYRTWLASLQPHDIEPEHATDIFASNLAPALAFGQGAEFARVFDTAATRHHNWGKTMDIDTGWFDSSTSDLVARVELLNKFLSDGATLASQAGIDDSGD